MFPSEILLPRKEERRSDADDGSRDGRKEEEAEVEEGKEEEFDSDEKEDEVIMKYGEI